MEQTETDKDRGRQTETHRDRQRQTETDRDRQRTVLHQRSFHLRVRIRGERWMHVEHPPARTGMRVCVSQDEHFPRVRAWHKTILLSGQWIDLARHTEGGQRAYVYVNVCLTKTADALDECMCVCACLQVSVCVSVWLRVSSCVCLHLSLCVIVSLLVRESCVCVRVWRPSSNIF